MEHKKGNGDDNHHACDRSGIIPAAEMRGRWESHQYVLHDESDDQGEQPKTPKDHVDRKPYDRPPQEGSPEVIAPGVRDGA